MTLLFGPTQLRPAQIDILAIMLVISFAFLPFRSLLLLFIPIFSTLGLTRPLIIAAMIILVTLFGVHWLFTPHLGIPAVMLSFSAANAAGACVLMAILTKHLGGMLFLGQVFSKPISVFVLPSAVSVLVCSSGQVFVTNIYAALIISTFACFAFAFVLICKDPAAHSLWRSLSQKIIGRFRKTL